MSTKYKRRKHLTGEKKKVDNDFKRYRDNVMEYCDEILAHVESLQTVERVRKKEKQQHRSNRRKEKCMTNIPIRQC